MQIAANNDYPLFILARIVNAQSGGPIRLKIVGNQTKITGKEPLVKAGYRSMPWESERGELPVMRMAEVASRVVSILSQPHRLEIFVPSLDKTFQYTPDLLVMCDPSFCKEIQDGMPFWQCARKPFLTRIKESSALPLVLEVKRETDRSMSDPSYLAKIGLAFKVYELARIPFAILKDRRDIEGQTLEIVNAMTDYKFTECGTTERMIARRVCGRYGQATFGELAFALGGGNRLVGEEKVYSLHIHRYLSIDLSQDLQESTPVYRMAEEPSNLQTLGRGDLYDGAWLQ